MIAQKAQYMLNWAVKPRERVRVLWERLYSSTKAKPERSYGVLYDTGCIQ